MGVMNLEDQLCFYRAYHFHPVNVLIHLVFIPTILFSSVTFLSYVNVSEYVNLPIANAAVKEFVDRYVLNLGSLLIISFSSFYILLDFFNGVLFSLLILAGSYLVESLYDVYPALKLVKYSILLHVAAWIAQFIGHGFFEHRLPLLLDNLVQALVLAPFFVFYELQFFLGFNKSLKIRMDNKALKLVSEFRKLKRAKKSE